MMFLAAAAAFLLILGIWYFLPSRPSWWFLRDRPTDPDIWRRTFSAEQESIVLGGLQAISESFLLRPKDTFRLRPDDKLLDIYRAAYPSKQTPDALEFHVLSQALRTTFHVPESSLADQADPTVRDVINMCLRYGGT